MAYEEINERAFGWDDEIKNDGPDFVLLPEGDYLFTVTGFERACYARAAPNCRPARWQKLTIRVHGGDKGETSVTHRLFTCISAARGCLRLLREHRPAQHGEPLRPPLGRAGRRTGLPTSACWEYTKQSGPNAGQTGQSNEITRFPAAAGAEASRRSNLGHRGAF